MSALLSFAFLTRPIVLILAKAMPALSANHIPRTEDSLRHHWYAAHGGPRSSCSPIIYNLLGKVRYTRMGYVDNQLLKIIQESI